MQDSTKNITFALILAAVVVLWQIESCDNRNQLKERDAQIDIVLEQQDSTRRQNSIDREESRRREAFIIEQRDSVYYALENVDKEIIIIEQGHAERIIPIDTASSAYIERYWATELNNYKGHVRH